MNRIAFAIAAVGLGFSTAEASPLLVFVDQPGCQTAARFAREVVAEYPPQGIPIHRLTFNQAWPTRFSNITPARVTPTFILIENGEEVGRIVGYSTKRRFWRGMEELIRRR